MRLMVSLGISSPINFLAFSKLKRTSKSFILLGYTSLISLVISPPAISCINNAARFKAYSVMLGSIPRSNLNEASVFKAWRFAVFLTLTGLK